MDRESNLDFITLGDGICSKCIHYLLSKRGQSYPSCEAFPDGIPEEIFMGEFIHILPYEGDNNIHYEPRKGIVG